ncbi:hypothetical protein HID58_062485 [Brassica napus]|uniref:RNase H type-1 domain-containing protein n=1 Tax=Brassica napus TaxID=3708 RepID=A0ABQ8A1P6_BRANA|nr:hypothetical protein HID58_062485 [Brassica napus]
MTLLEAVWTGVEEERRMVCFESDYALVIKAVSSGTCIPELCGVERRMLCFESDYALVIKAVSSGACIPELYGVVSDILSFVSIFEFVSFAWIPRKRNGQANMLAKSVLIAGGTLVVD